MASRGLRTAEGKEAGATGGTTALGLEGVIGRIARGYKADIVFLDLSNINFVPLNDVANQVVNCEDSSAVESVMIGGRMILQNRRFTDIDWDKVSGRQRRPARDSVVLTPKRKNGWILLRSLSDCIA